MADQKDFSSQTAVSQYLITCFQGVIENNSVPKMELVLKMITKNLTFDDPGMFVKSVIRDEKDHLIQTTTVMWLVNQVIYVSNNPEFYRSMEIITDLQQNIISASFMKQPVFFNKLIRSYIEFTNQLSNADVKLTKPLIITLFQVKDFDLGSIVPNSIYNAIEIRTMQSLNNLQNINIRLLSHAVTQMNRFEDDLIVMCAQCVLTAFKSMNLQIKTVCMKFFIKLFCYTDKLNVQLQSAFVIILKHIADNELRLPAWRHFKIIKNNDVIAYIQTVIKLLENLQIVQSLDETLLIQASFACFTIINTHHNEKMAEYDQVIASAYKLLKSAFAAASDPLLFAELCEMLEFHGKDNAVYCQTVELLESVAIHELKGNKLQSWQKVNVKIQNLLDQNDTQLHILLNQMKCFKAVFKTARNIEHNITIYQQQKYCKESTSSDFKNISSHLATLNPRNTNCGEKKLFTNLDVIISKIIKKFQAFVTSNQSRDASMLLLISETSIELLGLSDCHEIDDYLQMQLLMFALSPFLRYSELLYSHFQQAFESTFDSINQIIAPAALNQQWRLSALELIAKLNLEFLSIKNRDIFMDFIMQIFSCIKESEYQKLIMEISIGLIIQDSFRLEIYENFLRSKMDDERNHLAVSENLKSFLCLSSGSCYIFLTNKDDVYRYKILCKHCDLNLKKIQNEAELNESGIFVDLLMRTNGKFVLSPKLTYKFDANCSNRYFKLFNSTDTQTRTNMTECIPALLNHLSKFSFQPQNIDYWLDPMMDGHIEIRMNMCKHINAIPYLIQNSSFCASEKHELIQKCLKKLLACVKKFLANGQKPDQACALNSILAFATSKVITEKSLMYCFRTTLYFCICSKSQVSRKATLCAMEMCQRFGLTPATLLKWYKTNLFKFMIQLCVSNFVTYNIGLEKSLFAIFQMFGYRYLRQDFIAEHYGTILAMLIPWSIRYEKCLELIEEVCDIVQKDMATAITNSFLSIYIHLYLNESNEMNTKCMDFIIQNTGNTLYQLLKSDVKRTIAETLVYYRLNPEFVMSTFRNFLIENYDGGYTQNDLTTKILAEYITTRFLGVMCHFEQILILDSEKFLKREVLLSLGEIMRFMGSEQITQFRFKLLAVLRAALNLKELRDICAEVWKIFISTVDLISLGPLLSTIFVSLEPLLATHPEEVNDMLKYLVIKNGSLLSVYIPDLFFINDTNVSQEIKTYVSRYTEKANESFVDKFAAMIKHVNHDNLTVRIYGLNYLSNLFKDNRDNLNQLIIRQQKMHPIIENLLDNLMICIKSHDESLQTATGKCLGQLGALEPSLLSPNYGPQESFARDINTDEFAIMALAELCKGYQFQKDTKHVDTYSLAIQEILLARQVCPKTKKNMKVWEAIPERMRPLMEPLLTSCYTMPNGGAKVSVHPIFGSYRCRTYEEWAVTWATKNIEVITDETIKNLLRSLKPCMRFDIRMLSVFLPYIIIHALQLSDPDDRQSIAEEFYAVFAAVINPSDKYDNKGLKCRSMRGVDFVSLASEADDLAKDEPIDIGIKCAKLAFSQLDFIDRWLRTTKPSDLNHKTVKNFLQQFDKKIIASANFACGEYARALMYLESYIEENRSGRFQSELSFLSQIYAELMDPDSLEGALNMKNTEPTLTEQIMKNSAQGRLQESVVCFERLMHENGLSENNAIEMIQCYLGLNQPETAILLAEGLMKQMYDQNIDALVQSSAEPLWRLGRFEELSDLIESSNMQNSPNWGVRCGQILLNFRQDHDSVFTNEVDKSRLVVLKSLRIVGDEENSYQKGYSNVMKLHLISEIEQARIVIDVISNGGSDDNSETITNLLSDWDARIQLLQPSARIIEPVLCLRRIVLNEVKSSLKRRLKNENLISNIESQINHYIGASWIKSTELARNEGMLQQGDVYILNAEPYKQLDLFIEKAKMFWKKGDQANSFKVLERGIEEINGLSAERAISKAELKVLGEAKFLIASYNAESLNINTQLNIKYFKSANKALSQSEKCIVHYAQYLDKTLSAMPTNTIEQQHKTYEYQVEIIFLYCKSLLYGTKYIYQSLPRVLTLWLDFTADVSLVQKDEMYPRYCAKMNKFIGQFAQDLPAFIFFTAFSQLVSRICHPSTEVYNVLKTIIIKLILAFPQQSMWMILSVYKSSYANRVRRCTEVFSDKRLSARPVQKLIQDFNSLAEKMIELTNKELPTKPQKFLIDLIYPQFPNILSRSGFSQILLPIEKFMQPVLPAVGKRDEPLQTFNAFPNKEVYIAGVRNELTVFPSLQRPRRVTLIGSDGKDYIILMKAKDDLRKDYRLMEFNNVVKQFLHENSEARQRRLNIRTYAVMPLNEDCGIIEWVSNLQAFRTIVNGYYKQKNLGVSSKEIKEGQALAKDSIEKRREWFKKIVAKHPPTFADWFRERFTTPHNWYQARSSYVRTTAVMSIVGYILGLGDRHGENILFDAANGDLVHVDFNCLFNKGELFEIPEVVPFRLTHNMVHAMGPLGVEGLYRKCCEITMRVLQEQTPTLMSILRPFVYDPLVSWSRHGKNDGRSERTDSQAMTNVQHIEQRLKGYVKINGTNSSMPLSIEGVVNHGIAEATDIDKLCRMYVGWGGYL